MFEALKVRWEGKKLNVFHLKCRLETVVTNHDPINPFLALGKIQGAGVCSLNATMLDMLRGLVLSLLSDSAGRLA